MTGSKCSQCGFVSSSSNQTCKRCGSPLSQAGSYASQAVGFKLSKRTKMILGVIAGSVSLYLAYSLTSKLFPPKQPSPEEVARLLYNDDALKLPLVCAFPNAFTKQINRDDLQRASLIEEHREQQVLDRLGLITVSFTKDKNEMQECWRYRLEPQFHYSDAANAARVMVPDREGFYERCEDVWNYHTSIDYLDPENIDKAALAERLRSMADISLPVSHFDDRYASRGATVSSAYIPIGSVEIVEVSEVVPGNNGYTVGFKFRMKPNGLGELFDVNSSVHKSLPVGIRELFKTKLLEDGSTDKRPLYIARAQSADGLTFAHADFVPEGIFDRKWKVAKVYLDQVDKTQYTYRPVEPVSAQ